MFVVSEVRLSSHKGRVVFIVDVVNDRQGFGFPPRRNVSVRRKKEVYLVAFDIDRKQYLKINIPQKRVACRKRNDDRPNIWCKNKPCIIRSVKKENKLTFRMSNCHSFKRFEGKITNSLELILNQEACIYSYSQFLVVFLR